MTTTHTDTDPPEPGGADVDVAADQGEAGGPAATPVMLVGVDEVDEILAELPQAVGNWARINGFSGKLGQSLRIPDETGGIDRVLVGWGDAAARRRGRFHLGDFARNAAPGTYRLVTELDPDMAEEAALGWLLSRYKFERYKKLGEDRSADLVSPEGVNPARLGLIAEGVFFTRDLINTPANDMGPAGLEAVCRKVAGRHGAEISVTTGEELIEANLPLIHTVGRAGAEAPRLIDIRWGAEDKPMVTLVGKGVCFDTGGLNLKPGNSMALMKKDMGGAATVLGLAHMIMGLRLPVRLRVLIPAVENAVAGNAMRPGDVLTSRKGLSIEINNTDAEGRLVLADALTLASEEAPDLIVDMATLTGAARVALGPDLAPFYTDDAGLAAALIEAGQSSADPLWQMPLWAPYERDIEPEIADLDNAPKGGFAGSITAALFLKRFVDQAAWVHFDIYGWVPKARPGQPAGGECQAARAVLAVLEDRYGDA